MKKFITIFVCLILSVFSFANDTYFFSSGGSLTPTTEKDTSVRMEGEVISLKLEQKYYQVTVDFDFYNEGPETTLTVGFPFFEAGLDGHGKIYDFECWTNGEETDYKDLLIDRKFSNFNFNDPQLENAYVREVKFAEKAITKTRVSYKSEYGWDTTGSYTKYLYGTGSTWKGTIGSIKLILENNKQTSYPDIVEMGSKNIASKLHRTADNIWEADFYDVEPNYTDCFTIHCTDIIDDIGPKIWVYIFDGRETKNKISAEKIYFYTMPQLRIFRNAFFAIHGYHFKSQDLIELFNTEDKGYWYYDFPNRTYTEDSLSEIEKYNVDFIQKEEQARKKTEYKSLWDSQMAGTYVAEDFLQRLKESKSYVEANELCKTIEAYDVLVPEAKVKKLVSSVKFHDRYALNKENITYFEGKIVDGKPCILDRSNNVNYVQISKSEDYSTEMEKLLTDVILKDSPVVKQAGIKLTETGFIYKNKKYTVDLDKWHYTNGTAVILYSEDFKTYLGLVKKTGLTGLYTMRNNYDLVYEPETKLSGSK